jgi:alpha-galactosidase
MPIHALEDHHWILETNNVGYALTVTPTKHVVHGYWGKRLPYPEDYPRGEESYDWASFNGGNHITREEYPAYAGTSYVEPCLKANIDNSILSGIVRDTVLLFESAEQPMPDTLNIHLRDVNYPFNVTLHYKVHETHDLIERWVTLKNETPHIIGVERMFSAQWHLPKNDSYRLMHMTGRWNDEMHIRREPLTHGVKVLESRRITTSHHHNPYFAIDRGNADETQGEVWFGVLAWSGNWKITAEVTDFGSTRVNIGLNDWDFMWELDRGESFVTPSTFAGYTQHGFGAASHILHDFIRDEVIPHGKTLHKILYNSWEATTFNVDVESQNKLAEIAAEMGIELFVMDDGWFHGRNLDNAGLGDWWADEKKFPNGLKPLVEKVNALGMDFGLWIEPEMVNPDSDLYRAHPDWAIQFETRKSTLMREQLILNMANKDVQDYLIDKLDKILSENNIAFIKWDMNRNVSEPAMIGFKGDQREIWVRYVQGVYKVWDTLRERHPDVIWQSCSGGGGRADVEILRRADQIWISDNTEGTARLSIQEGFSNIFPANTMEAWVTDMNHNNLSLDFRFHVSMCGSLGVGGHLLHWSESDRKVGAKWIALYKEIRHIIQFGDLYRLRSPQENAYSAVQYVSKDKAEGVLFVFRTYLPDPTILPMLYLCGLEPNARYHVEGFGTRSGAAWMNAGVFVEIQNFESKVLKIKQV